MKLLACLVFMVIENTSQGRSWNYFIVESINGSKWALLSSLNKGIVWISQLMFDALYTIYWVCYAHLHPCVTPIQTSLVHRLSYTMITAGFT